VLYRTGDLVRTLKDGAINYIGRIDNQIKLRGYRLELDEIARAAEFNLDIQQAIAICEGKHENAFIILFVIQKNKVKPISDELIRRTLTTKLPSYMVPSFIINVTEVPITDMATFFWTYFLSRFFHLLKFHW